MRLYAFKSLGKGFGVGTGIGGRRSRKSSGGGCLGIIVLAVIGIGVWFYSVSPWLFWAMIWIPVVLVLVYLCNAASSEPTNCEVCGNPLGKKYGEATIEGQTKTVCSNCLNGIKRRMSSRAVSALFDKPAPEEKPPPEKIPEEVAEPALLCPHCRGDIPETGLKPGITFLCPNCHKMIEAAEAE